MSGGGLKLRDVGKLADSRAVFEFETPVSALPGLPPEFKSDGDPLVRVQVCFGREQALARAEIRLEAQLQLICQRCMQRMPLPVRTDSRVLVVESEREADEVPTGWETYLAPEGRLSLEALAAEELLLALPIVPLHEAGEACVNEQPVPETPPAHAAGAGNTTRPFADLRELLQVRGKGPEN